jgi:hypothetical protein
MNAKSSNSRTATIFVLVQSGLETGYLSLADAENFARYVWGGTCTIEQRQFQIPEDAFWDGDLISVELHRGGQDENSINSGGQWIGPVYGHARVMTVSLSTGRIIGFIAEPGTDKCLQCMPLHAGIDGFPYRNAKLVRQNDLTCN